MADDDDWEDDGDGDGDWGGTELVQPDQMLPDTTTTTVSSSTTMTGGSATAYTSTGLSASYQQPTLESRARSFMEQVDQTRSIGIQIRRHHREKMQDAFMEFSHKCVELMKEFNTEMDPLRQRLQEIKAPFVQSLERQYVQIPCPWLEHYQQLNKGNPRANLESKDDDTVVSFDPIQVNEEDPRKQILEYFQSIETEVQKEIQSQMREPTTGFDVLEKRDKNGDTLIGMIPWLPKDMAMATLVMKNESLQAATDWLLSGDQNTLYLEILEYTQRNPDWHAVPLVEDRHQTDKRVLNRSTSTNLDKCVTFQIESVEANGRVRLCPILDRNRVPIDPGNSRRIVLDLDELFMSGMKLPLMDGVISDMRNRRLKIIIQAASHVLGFDAAAFGVGSTKEYHPIAVEPTVRLEEYEMSINPHTGTLISIRHRVDGKVLGHTVVDDGSTGMLQSSTVDLYTQVLDDVTHNIVMILMDDYRDELTFDVVNLSFTETTVEEYAKFDEDASGRKLQYRIVVKDQRVAAVLAPVGNQIKSVNFVEHSLPKEGDLVALPNDQLGVVNSIPTGLIVTNKVDPDVEEKRAQFERQGTVQRKYVAELGGYVDVEVMRLGGEWIIPTPLRQSFPACDLRDPDEEDLAIYMSLVDDQKASTKDAFRQKMTDIDDCLDKFTNHRSTFSREDVIEMSNRLTTLIKELKEELQNEEIQGDTELVQAVSRKMPGYEREKRAIMMEIRMGA